MKLGFNLLLWTTHVTEEHWPLLETLKATGYDGVEIPMFEGDPAHYEKLGRRLRELGLGATGIGVMPPGRSAISPEAPDRRAALDHIKWLIHCTVALGGEIAAGPFHQPLGVFSGRGPSADELRRCADVHKSAAQYAATAGIKLSVEPVNRFECYFVNTTAQAAELVRAVDEPNYGYLYDTFHANIEEASLPGAIAATSAAINHVHISENHRGIPGSGHIDFAPVFRALRHAGYDGWLTVEAFGSALPDLAAAAKIWRPLFAREADVYTGAYTLMRQGWDAAG